METLIEIVELCQYGEVSISRTPAGNFLVGVGEHMVGGETLLEAVAKARALFP